MEKKTHAHRSQSSANSPERNRQPFLDLKSTQSELKHFFDVEEDEVEGAADIETSFFKHKNKGDERGERKKQKANA